MVVASTGPEVFLEGGSFMKAPKSYLILAFTAFAFAGCGGSGNSSGGGESTSSSSSPQTANSSPATVSVDTNGDGIADATAGTPATNGTACANPIPTDTTEFQRVRSGTLWAMGIDGYFVLRRMRIHFVNESTHESFTTQHTVTRLENHTSRMRHELLCNGVTNPERAQTASADAPDLISRQDGSTTHARAFDVEVRAGQTMPAYHTSIVSRAYSMYGSDPDDWAGIEHETSVSESVSTLMRIYRINSNHIEVRERLRISLTTGSVSPAIIIYSAAEYVGMSQVYYAPEPDAPIDASTSVPATATP